MPDPWQDAKPIQDDPWAAAKPVQDDPWASATPASSWSEDPVNKQIMSGLKGIKQTGLNLWDQAKALNPLRDTGLTDEQIHALPLADKLKLALKTVGRQQLDYAEMPLRVVSGFGRDLIKAGLAPVEAAADLKEAIPQAAIQPQVNTNPADALAQARMLYAKTGKVAQPAPQPLSQRIAQWAAPVTHPTTEGLSPAEAGLIAPQTSVGRVADPVGQAALTGLEASATGGLGAGGAASRLVNPMAYFYAKTGADAYDTASLTRLPGGQKVPYAMGTGGLNAMGMALPFSPALEGIFESLVKTIGAPKAAQWLVGKVGSSAADAYLYNYAGSALQHKYINPDVKVSGTDNFLPAFGQMLAMKGVGTFGHDADLGIPLAKFQEGRTTASGSGETRHSIETGLQGLSGQNVADYATATGYWNRLSKKYSPEAREEALHAMDAQNAGLPAPKVSKEAAAFMKDPLWQEIRSAEATRNAAIQGYRGNEIPADNPNYVHRVVTAGVEPEGLPWNREIRTNASGLQSRSYMVHEDPSGNRTVVWPNANGDGYVDAAGNEVSQGDPGLKQATIKEIEAAVPGMNYRKDPLLNTLQNTVQLGGAQRGLSFIDALKNNPKWAAPADMEHPPEGWKPLSENALLSYPQLKGTTLEPRLADIFEDLAHENKRPQSANWLTKFGDLATQVGFTNPTLHAPNMVNHGLKSMGVEGMTKGFLSGRIGGNFDRAAAALASLHEGNPNQDIIDYLAAGGHLQTGKTASEPYFNLVGQEPGVNDVRQGNVAGATPGVGEAPSQNPITKMNQRYTWNIDDIIRMGLTLDHAERKGVPISDAVQEIARTYPSYRATHSELGDNAPDWLNNMVYGYAQGARLGNTPLLRFTKYGLGKWKSVATTGKDLFSGDRTGEALNKLGGLGLGTALTAGTLTPILQAVTQDDRAEASPGGSAHVIQQVAHAARYGDYGQQIANQFPTNPVLGAFLAAAGRGYAGRNLTNAGDYEDLKHQALTGHLSDAAETALKMGGDMTKGGAGAMVFGSDPLTQVAQGTKSAPGVLANLLLRGHRGSTPAETVAQEVSANRAPRSPVDATSQDLFKEKLRLANAVQTGDQETISDIQDRGILPQGDVDKGIEKASLDRENKLALKVKGFSFPDAVRVFRQANDKEKAVLLPLLQDKLNRLRDKDGYQEDGPLKDLVQEVEAAGNTPSPTLH